MVKLFIEYHIEQVYIDHYLQMMQKLSEELTSYEWLQSREKENLFLEIYSFIEDTEIDSMKHDRIYNADSSWREIDRFVRGGQEGIHAWSFETKSMSNIKT